MTLQFQVGLSDSLTGGERTLVFPQQMITYGSAAGETRHGGGSQMDGAAPLTGGLVCNILSNHGEQHNSLILPQNHQSNETIPALNHAAYSPSSATNTSRLFLGQTEAN